MVLGRLIDCGDFNIKQPRWRDRTVLLAKYKVKRHNSIIFEAASMPGEYYVSGENVMKCKLDNNGKIDVYVVPLDSLEPLEREK